MNIRIVSLEFVDLITDEMMKQVVEIVPVGFLGKYANNGQGMPSVIYWGSYKTKYMTFTYLAKGIRCICCFPTEKEGAA